MCCVSCAGVAGPAARQNRGSSRMDASRRQHRRQLAGCGHFPRIRHICVLLTGYNGCALVLRMCLSTAMTGIVLQLIVKIRHLNFMTTDHAEQSAVFDFEPELLVACATRMAASVCKEAKAQSSKVPAT